MQNSTKTIIVISAAIVAFFGAYNHNLPLMLIATLLLVISSIDLARLKRAKSQPLKSTLPILRMLLPISLAIVGVMYAYWPVMMLALMLAVIFSSLPRAQHK